MKCFTVALHCSVLYDACRAGVVFTCAAVVLFAARYGLKLTMDPVDNGNGMTVGFTDDGELLKIAAEEAKKSFACWDQFIGVSVIDCAVTPTSVKRNDLTGEINFSKTRAEKAS